MSRSTKDFKFYMKAVDDRGTFEGVAAVYGNVDLGGDVIESGAFTRTIKNNGGEVPILWQHDSHEPIGMGRLEDSKEGLLIHGDLVMESDVAKKAHGLMKAKVLKGLSIGYDTIVSEYDKANDIRKLKELKLWEVSLVTFPMNPKAQVTGVKGSIDELAAFLKQEMDEVKSGRRMNVATRDALKRAMDEISALMTADSDTDSAGKSLAKHNCSDSELHSLFDQFKNLKFHGA
ncbi:MAG TPA: HK97 family phage prohead protease [Clostridia bacterium]|nr:HK97 family phage prohead protease [Clostridia bacterium]